MSKSEKQDLVILVRLDSVHGFFSMADVLEIVGQLQQKGVDAMAERAPGALMDTPDAYYIKVPVDQQEWAVDELKGILA